MDANYGAQASIVHGGTEAAHELELRRLIVHMHMHMHTHMHMHMHTHALVYRSL